MAQKESILTEQKAIGSQKKIMSLPARLLAYGLVGRNQPRSLWYSSVGAGRRVGTAGPTPPPGVLTLAFGEQFFNLFFPKNLLFGGCLCRENGLFWEVVVPDPPPTTPKANQI